MTRLEELLNIIPETIEYPVLQHEWIDHEMKTDWSEDKHPYVLRMEKWEGRFLAYYVHLGFEGEQQILPLSDEELQEYKEYGCVLQYKDTSMPTLEEALENLLCWLKSTGLIC